MLFFNSLQSSQEAKALFRRDVCYRSINIKKNKHNYMGYFIHSVISFMDRRSVLFWTLLTALNSKL